jgi:hypothetical protein
MGWESVLLVRGFQPLPAAVGPTLRSGCCAKSLPIVGCVAKVMARSRTGDLGTKRGDDLVIRRGKGVTPYVVERDPCPVGAA